MPETVSLGRVEHVIGACSRASSRLLGPLVCTCQVTSWKGHDMNFELHEVALLSAEFSVFTAWIAAYEEYAESDYATVKECADDWSALTGRVVSSITSTFSTIEWWAENCPEVEMTSLKQIKDARAAKRGKVSEPKVAKPSDTVAVELNHDMAWNVQQLRKYFGKDVKAVALALLA